MSVLVSAGLQPLAAQRAAQAACAVAPDKRIPPASGQRRERLQGAVLGNQGLVGIVMSFL